MNQTPNYQLNQWEATDRVKREDFNADNARIDAALAGKGNCQIITGSYVGTGTCGPNAPNTLTFPKKPLVVFLCGTSALVAFYGAERAVMPIENMHINLTLSWSENTLSWYCYRGSDTQAYYQLNTEGKVYPYLALLEA